MTEPNEHGAEQEETGHIVSPKIYLAIVVILLFMTALTVFASYIEMGVFKATLVVLFFMHVKYSTKLTKLTIGAGIFTFLTLIALTLSDYISRAWGRW